MSVTVTSAAPDGWDAYVDAHPGKTAYHLAAAVGIGAATFGLRTSYLVSRDAQQRICGVLPLVEQSSLLFGRFLVSVPFFTYGGILANDDGIARALAERAIQLGRERKVDHVELRHVGPLEGVKVSERLEKVSMVLPLPATEEALSRQLGSKLRSQIKRAEREQPEVVWGGRELLRDFYEVFAPAMHELGTPVYPRRFFDAFFEAVGPVAACLVVRVRGEPMAAAIIVRHGSSIEVPWAASTRASRPMAINMRMYWELLAYSVRAGAARFDFGRSTVDSGTYKFKSQWGAKPMQLHWHYWLPQDAPIPRINHSNPKYAMAAKLWRKMPLACANIIGPLLIRHLP